MAMRNGKLGIGLVLLALAGCDDGAVSDEAAEGSSRDFTLQYWLAADECTEGHVCLPMEASADGSSLGICLPPPPVDGGAAPGSGASVGNCLAETWGGPRVCQPGEDWALRAVDACQSRGATLVDLHVLLSCNGLPGGAIFTCCWFGDTPADPPPPWEPECVELPIPGMGPEDGMPDPKAMAQEQCRAMGRELRDLYGQDFDDNGRPMTWIAICCGPVVDPPPPPVACQGMEMVFDCWTARDWKMDVHERCAAAGGEIRDLQASGCGADGQFVVRAACCFGSIEPPPEPPPGEPECPIQAPLPIGDGTCDASRDWRGEADLQCRIIGGWLRDVQVRSACDDGTIGAIIATCCLTQDPTRPNPVP